MYASWSLASDSYRRCPVPHRASSEHPSQVSPCARSAAAAFMYRSYKSSATGPPISRGLCVHPPEFGLQALTVGVGHADAFLARLRAARRFSERRSSSDNPPQTPES